MKDYLKDRKYQYWIPFALMGVYVLFYLITMVSGDWFDHHRMFLISLLVLMLINISFFAIQHKSKLMAVGIALMGFASLVDLIFEILILTESIQNVGMALDILIHIIYLCGMVILTAMLYNLSQIQRERHRLFQLFFTYNHAVYYEFDRKSMIWSFTFSESFLTMHGLNQRNLRIDDADFRSCVELDDTEHLAIYDNPSPIDEVNLRIRFPGMAKSTWIHSKVVIRTEDLIAGVDIDVSHYQLLIDELDQSQSRLGTIEMEERAILEHTNDLIVKFRTDGQIVFATENYAAIFGVSSQQLFSMNVEDVNKLTGVTDDDWYKETVETGYTESVIEIAIRGEKRWIFWKNRTLYNPDGIPEYVLSVGHDITDLKRLNNELYQKSLRDDLTGLYNRAGLFQELDKIAKSDSCVLFFLDLENYAYINDYFGHEVGDLIIQDVATELLWFRRKGAITARISGDEFIIVAYEVQTIQEAILNIYRFLETTHTVQGVSITVKKNIGYAVYPDDSPTIKSLVSLASMAMLESKASNVQTAVRYRPEFQQNVKDNLMMAGAIKHAIEAGEIEIHFQNVVEATSGEPVFLESLARWHRQNGEYVTPFTLFHHATRSKLVLDLDRYLIDKSLRYFQMLVRRPEYQDAILSVNVTPSTLLDKKFPDFLRLIMSKYALASYQIMIEVAETTFVGNLDLCFQQLRSLRKLGVRIAIDDFGRDYSSLSILTALDFDVIKIDRVFVDKINLPINREIIKMVQSIAHANGKTVIAEGVETKTQAENLQLLGITLHQGYLYSKPKKLTP
jgi:diguanylate cyclase (GGDEF)-like protein/PAS domain S-box-containing protein